ncbi:MAG TPA: hypothetical protein VE956_20300 [Nodularia sp. (in: cyanobacteria)]|nr:hypothetical protein [Nodularia sp. (in: cyanobacteria)]
MTTTRENFESKIRELGDSLNLSQFHLKIHEWMGKERDKRLNEYPPFFALSRMAHYETGVLKLVRAYDQDKKTLGLVTILNIIQSDYRDWGCSEPLDNKVMEQDKNFVTVTKGSNSLVEKLIHLRDKTIAHTDHRQYPSTMGNDITKVYKKYGDEFIWRSGRLTTEDIEKKPTAERDAILNQISEEIFQVFDQHQNKVLGKDVPTFNELYQLTNQGIEICNRYMQKLSIPLIEPTVEGIDWS